MLLCTIHVFCHAVDLSSKQNLALYVAGTLTCGLYGTDKSKKRQLFNHTALCYYSSLWHLKSHEALLNFKNKDKHFFVPKIVIRNHESIIIFTLFYLCIHSLYCLLFFFSTFLRGEGYQKTIFYKAMQGWACRDVT